MNFQKENPFIQFKGYFSSSILLSGGFKDLLLSDKYENISSNEKICNTKKIKTFLPRQFEFDRTIKNNENNIWEAFASGMSNVRYFIALNLSRNQLSCKTLSMISNTIISMDLEQLNLCSCSIYDSSCESVSYILQNSHNLKNVKLNRNKIKDP